MKMKSSAEGRGAQMYSLTEHGATTLEELFKFRDAESERYKKRCFSWFSLTKLAPQWFSAVAFCFSLF